MKIRVHELAKKVGLSSKEVIALLLDLGIEAKSHSSSIDEKDASKLEKTILKGVESRTAKKTKD